MPGRQHEPVAVGPVGLRRRVAQEARPERRRPSARRPSGRPGARSWPAGRRRSTASGSCRWRGGRGRASRWSSGGTPGGRCGGRWGGHCRSRPPVAESSSTTRRRYHRPMPRLPTPRPRRPRRPDRPTRRPSTGPARVVVLGDLDGRRRPGARRDRSRRGTDVPGRVALVAGWLGGEHRPLAGAPRAPGAVSSARSDAMPRAVRWSTTLRADRVTPRVTRVAGARTGPDRRPRLARWRALVRRRPRRRRPAPCR